jgi:hypothetical protein
VGGTGFWEEVGASALRPAGWMGDGAVRCMGGWLPNTETQTGMLKGYGKTPGARFTTVSMKSLGSQKSSIIAILHELFL